MIYGFNVGQYQSPELGISAGLTEISLFVPTTVILFITSYMVSVPAIKAFVISLRSLVFPQA